VKPHWITIPVVALTVICARPALADQALAEKAGCLRCHGVTKTIIGPAFHDIAARYKDDPSARAALIEIVRTGGKGNWTAVTDGGPMPPYGGRLSNAEIERLVDWVLGL
jgi:cytochrome c551/c552